MANKWALYTLSRLRFDMPAIKRSGKFPNGQLCVQCWIVTAISMSYMLTQLIWERRDHLAEFFHSRQVGRLESATTVHHDRDP